MEPYLMSNHISCLFHVTYCIPVDDTPYFCWYNTQGVYRLRLSLILSQLPIEIHWPAFLSHLLSSKLTSFRILLRKNWPSFWLQIWHVCPWAYRVFSKMVWSKYLDQQSGKWSSSEASKIFWKWALSKAVKTNSFVKCVFRLPRSWAIPYFLQNFDSPIGCRAINTFL